MKKIICSILIFTVTVTSLTGCAASNNTMPLLKEYEGTTYKGREVYNNNIDEVYKAAVSALHDKGFQVTLSDSYAGMLTAEYNCENLLPEEMAAMEKNQTEATCITILGIVLVFGLVVMLISSLSNKNSSSSESVTYSSDSYCSDSKVRSNRYQLTLTFTGLGTEKTEVSLNVIKSVVENGTTISQNILENKFLNNDIFNKIREHLKAGYFEPLQNRDSIMCK